MSKKNKTNMDHMFTESMANKPLNETDNSMESKRKNLNSRRNTNKVNG